MNKLKQSVNVNVEILKTFVRVVAPYTIIIYIIYIYLYILMFTTATDTRNARRYWVARCERFVAVAIF